MSKSFLKVSEAYNKLGLSGGGTNWIRKSELIATGKCDTTKLEKYGNNDFVVDDDIVKVRQLQDCFVGEYIAGVSDGRYGYYYRDFGTYNAISNTTKCDEMWTFHTDGTTNVNFVVNFHLRRLVPDTYNRIAVKFFDMNGNLELNVTGKLTYINSDFNQWKDDNGVKAGPYISSIVGVKKRIEIYLSKD